MKLYAHTNDGTNVEIIESEFAVDGYSVADRLLEGLIFHITFDDKEVTDVRITKSQQLTFDDFNTTKWLNEVKKYAQRILDKGETEEVMLSFKLKAKYNAKYAFIE